MYRKMGKFHGNQHTQTEYDDYSYGDLVVDVRSLAKTLEKTPTTRDAMEDDTIPCLDRIYDIVDGSWQAVLADAGVGQTQVERYGPDEQKRMVRDLRRVQNESSGYVLTTRDYDENGGYPTSVIKDFFGSWADACAAAGVDHGTKHGTRCTGPRGREFESKQELAVAQMLYENDVNYVVHPRLRKTNWVGDFYLPKYELWVEVDGYEDSERPNATSFGEKLSFYHEMGMDVVVVSSADELIERFRNQDILPPLA